MNLNPISTAPRDGTQVVVCALLEGCRKALYALKGREHDGFLRAAIAKATGATP